MTEQGGKGAPTDPLPGSGNLGAVAALLAESFPQEPWTEEGLKSLLAMPGVLAWHALSRHKEETSLAAFLLLRLAGEESEVLTLAVAPAFRRQGLASRLLLVANEDLRQRGALVLYLEVSEGNTAAWTLYRGLGFRCVGRRKTYYRDGTDALILQLDSGKDPLFTRLLWDN